MRTVGPVRVRPSAQATDRVLARAAAVRVSGNVVARRRRRRRRTKQRNATAGNRDLNAGNFRRILDSTRRSSEEEGDRLDRLECMLFSKDGRIEKAADTSQVQSSQARAVARLKGQGQFSKDLFSGQSKQDEVRDFICRHHKIQVKEGRKEDLSNGKMGWKVILAAAVISSLLSGETSHAQESDERSGKKRMKHKFFAPQNTLSNLMPLCGHCN